ncbi:MAG: hypothetical protein WDW38_007010 [Sanguina aurantia]
MTTLSTISAPAVVELTAPAPAITIDVIGLSATQVTPVSDKRGGRHSKGVSRSNSTVQDDSTKIHLVWQDLVVVATRMNRPLLNKISGQIETGLYAIMGPSGSGKTTLLNTLACRLDRNTRVTGEFRLNGQPYSIGDLKKIAGYVMQDDLLNGNLTCQETLSYTAQLRLPPSMEKEEKVMRVSRVLQQVGLEHARNTIVGSPMKKGISGGERKRLCVAMELLTQPLLLFLDEPTSGLDSVTALSLVTLLKRLADAKACTVVCTIHQPQSKIFKLFDHLLLLKMGSIVYSGSAQSALTFFAESGFPVPVHENPADHFLDVISPNLSDSIVSIAEKERALINNYRPPKVDLLYGADQPLFLPREQTPWGHQFLVLLRRSIKEQWRKKNIILVQLLQAVVMAVLIGTAFLHIGDGQSSAVRRQPVLFFCVINQGMFGALIVINSFPAERMLVLRERAAGTYYVSAYFLAKTTAETFTQVLSPVLFTIVVYFLIGLQPVASKFFIFMAFMVLSSLAATSLALMVSAIGRTTDMSVTILPMVLEICRLFGGFFLSPANLPKYFSWLDALSYAKYCYIAICRNELTGLVLTCTPQQQLADGTCPIPDGETTERQLGLIVLSIGECAGILVSYIFLCRFFAFLGVRYIKY